MDKVKICPSIGVQNIPLKCSASLKQSENGILRWNTIHSSFWAKEKQNSCNVFNSKFRAGSERNGELVIIYSRDWYVCRGHIT